MLFFGGKTDFFISYNSLYGNELHSKNNVNKGIVLLCFLQLKALQKRQVFHKKNTVHQSKVT
jgi:hypothetical protein